MSGSSTDVTTTVAELKDQMRRFAEARGWEPYHSPKNLVMALASEVGELCDIFRWLTPKESRTVVMNDRTRTAIADELADVTNIIVLLSLHTGIDLTAAVGAKMVKNEQKYPAPSGSDLGLGLGLGLGSSVAGLNTPTG